MSSYSYFWKVFESWVIALLTSRWCFDALVSFPMPFWALLLCWLICLLNLAALMPEELPCCGEEGYWLEVWRCCTLWGSFMIRIALPVSASPICYVPSMITVLTYNTFSLFFFFLDLEVFLYILCITLAKVLTCCINWTLAYSLFSLTALHIQGNSYFSYTSTLPSQQTHTFSTQVTASLPSACHSPLFFSTWSHPTPSSPKTHSLLKSCQGRQDTFCLSLLSFTFPLLLWTTTVLQGAIFQCLTCGVTPLLIAADCSCELCFGGKQNYRLLRMTAEAKLISWPPRAPFWLWNPSLRHIKANTKMSKVNTGTCVIITFTHCWFAIIDTYSCNKMALSCIKQSSSFYQENCLCSVALDHTCQKDHKFWKFT